MGIRKRRFKPTIDSLYLLYTMLNVLVATSVVVVFFFADNGQCQQHLHQDDCINHVGLLQGYTGQEMCHWNSDLGYCIFEPNKSWNISIVYVMGATTLITVFLDRLVELLITPLNRLNWSSNSTSSLTNIDDDKNKEENEKDERDEKEANEDKDIDGFDIEHTPPREHEDENAATMKKQVLIKPGPSLDDITKQRRLSKMSGMKGFKIAPNAAANNSSEDENNPIPGRKKSTIKPMPHRIET